jgi:hypothetical protein
MEEGSADLAATAESVQRRIAARVDRLALTWLQWELRSWSS